MNSQYSKARSIIGGILSRLRHNSSHLARWNAMQSSIHASPEDRAISEAVRTYTMTGPYRIHALLDAVRYVTARNIPGAFVECGVWRGGSVMAMLLKLIQLGKTDRDVYLYDTFEGMTAPSGSDTSEYEPAATSTWERARSEGGRGWDNLFNEKVFTEQKVREALLQTGYPAKRLHFVRGSVEQTIPTIVPDHIALLRLDTDWYESTLHELKHLYPRLSDRGVIIIDDYGHWAGCRKAVDEFFDGDTKAQLLLNRIDYSARMAVKG